MPNVCTRRMVTRSYVTSSRVFDDNEVDVAGIRALRVVLRAPGGTVWLSLTYGSRAAMVSTGEAKEA